MDEPKCRNDPRERHAGHTHSEDADAGVDVVFRHRIAREPLPPQRGDRAGENRHAEQPEQTVHHHTERGGSLPADGRFLQKIVALHQVAARAAGDEEAEEKPHHQQPIHARPRDADALHAQQNLPAHPGENFKHPVGANARHQPAPICLRDRIAERPLLRGIVENHPQQPDGEADLQRP